MVCTANICRSPALQYTLRARLPPAIIVESAGIDVQPGRNVDSPMARLLGERGLDTSRFQAQQITAALVDRSDLILTATRSQRSTVVQLSPRAVRRTFTVREFVRLAGPMSIDFPDGTVARRHVVSSAFASRQAIMTPEDDDIADPFGRSRRSYARCLGLIDDLVDRVGHLIDPVA